MKRAALRAMAMGMAATVAFSAAMAGEAAAAPEIKRVGIIRLDKIFSDDYQYVKDTRQSVEQRLKPDIDALQALEDDMKADIQKLQSPMIRQGSAEARILQLGIQMKEVQLQESMRKLDQERNKYFLDLHVEVYQALLRAAKEYVAYYKYDLIVLGADPEIPQQIIDSGDFVNVRQEIFLLRRYLHIGPSVDITTSMLGHLNQRYQRHKQNSQNPL